MSSVGRPLLFYSAWPLAYHNVEAERKAVRFAEEGYDVVYVTGVGTRNPRVSRFAKLADRVRRKVLGSDAREVPESVEGLRTAAVAVVPPRQVGVVRRLNERWLERQLRGAVGDWSEAVAWIRWPTQELVAALEAVRPALIVYESVDANHLSPGIIEGRWRQVFEDAERALVDLADVVVVPGEALAERYRPWGKPVEILPHGVDVGAWRHNRGAGANPVLGFIGTLDYRLDVPTLRAIAEARPAWSIRLIGPQQEGFDEAALSDLANVSVQGAVEPDAVPGLNSSFDIGVLVYRDHPHYTHMAPLKALELLAAGTPVIGRRNPALAELGALVRFAATPEEYVTGIEDILATDSADQARTRRDAAEARGWDQALDSMCRLVRERLDR